MMTQGSMLASQKDRLIPIHVTEDGTECSFTLPYIPCEYIDMSRHVGLHNICELLQCSRVESTKARGFLDDVQTNRRLRDGRTMFIVTGHYEFSQEFHQRYFTRDFRQPLRLTTSLQGYSSRSTLLLKTRLDDPDTSRADVILDLCYVLVDNKTRKSTPFPDWFKQKFSKYETGAVARRYRRMERPGGGVFSKTYETVVSDLDFNMHINSNVYIREAINLAAVRGENGDLQWFRGPVFLNYLAKSMDVLYVKECRLGDTIVLFMWEDNEKPRTLHFQFFKDEELVFQCSIQFYDVTNSKL